MVDSRLNQLQVQPELDLTFAAGVLGLGVIVTTLLTALGTFGHIGVVIVVMIIGA